VKQIGMIERKEPQSEEWLDRQLRVLQIQMTELERSLKRKKGEAVFAAYKQAVAAAVEKEFPSNDANVVRLRER
jgi:hypothetical protein